MKRIVPFVLLAAASCVLQASLFNVPVVAQPAEPRTCLDITPETPLVEQAVFPSLIPRSFRDTIEGRQFAHYPRWSPDGRWIGISYLTKPLGHIELVFVWNVATGQPELAFSRYDRGAALWPSQYSWSPDSTRLALTSNGIYSIVSLETGTHFRLNTGEAGLDSPVWSPDSAHTATFEADNTIRIWDAATGQRLREFNTTELISGPNIAVWADQGLRWLTRDESSIVQVWEENSSEPIFTIGPDLGRVLLSPSGRFLVSAGRIENGVRIWNVSTGQLEQTLHVEAYPVAWSLDGV
jgi:WD40 repeat protein